MKNLALVLLMALLISASAAHATVWNVIVADFQFSPADLTILQGDTVVWHDTLGTHSVTPDCSPALFGQPAASAPWTYQFVFNISTGIYPYHCEIHPDLMHGMITVQDRGTWHVLVYNFAFNPANITIMQGDTVVWRDTLGFHDVHHTGNPSLFGNAAALAPWTYSFIFNLPLATYDYICTIHLFAGSVTVLVPPAPAAPAALVLYPEDSAHVRLTWDKVCGVSGYAVFRSSNVSLLTFPDSLGMTADTTMVDSISSLSEFYLVRAVSPAR